MAQSFLSKQPTVITVRHGESESNLVIHKSPNQLVDESGVKKLESFEDPALTATGIIQANLTAEHLYNHFITTYGDDVKLMIWISPFLRTRQTAEPFIKMASSLIENIRIEPMLQEFVRSGKELSSDFITETGLKNHQSWIEYQDDIKTLNEKIKTTIRSFNDNTHLVIFGHSLTTSILTTYQATNEHYITESYATIQLSNCSLTTVRYNERFKSWDILHVGAIAHLPTEYATGIHVTFGSRLIM